MKIIFAHIVFCVAINLYANDKVLMMEPYKVTPDDLHVVVNYDNFTRGVISIEVKDVKENSSAYKLGIRKGDHITAVNGRSVVGLDSALFLYEGRVNVEGPITFEGKRGIFRRKWEKTFYIEIKKK